MSQAMLRCEEWQPLHIGVAEALPTLDTAVRIISAWETITGLDSSAYFDVTSKFIRPKSWFGSVTLGNLTLEVIPRSSGKLTSEWMSRFDANVDLMLARLSDTTYRNLGDARLSSQGNRFEALVYSFCDAVSRARRGKIIRRYEGVTGTFDYPRGALQFPQQILSQIRNPQQFECSWIELTPDVPENRFIKAVLQTVRRFCSRQCQNAVDAILVNFDDVASHTQPLELAQRVRLDRLSGQYASVIELGRQLLEGKGLGVMYGSLDGASQVILSPKLFEQYISQRFQDIAEANAWTCLLQQRQTYLCQRANGSNLAEIIPDIRIVHLSGETILVADTKWKFPLTAGDQTDISSKDATQVLLYAAKFGARDAALIYPSLDVGSSETPSYEILNAPFGDAVYRLHVLRVPLLSADLSGIPAALALLFSKVAYCDEPAKFLAA